MTVLDPLDPLARLTQDWYELRVAERQQAARRLAFAQADFHEALQDLGEWGDRAAAPSQVLSWCANLTALGGLGAIFGFTILELVVRDELPGQQGLLVAFGIGLVMAAGTVFSVHGIASSGGRGAQLKAMLAALISASGLFAMRWHLAGGEWPLAVGWSALELGILLLFELQAFAWGNATARWAQVDGPHGAASNRVDHAEEAVKAARTELACCDQALVEARLALRAQLEASATPHLAPRTTSQDNPALLNK